LLENTVFEFSVRAIYTYESYGVLLPSDEPELKAAIDAAIQKMIDEGLMEELFAEWLD
jgi:ABC-type amino acid transport substrate-binding protein